MFEWDEGKRQQNLAKHKLDFLVACLLFDGRVVLTVPSKNTLEPRYLTIGMVSQRCCTVIWTWRGESHRIISFRTCSESRWG